MTLLTLDQVRAELRSAAEAAGGVREYARRHGFTHGYLSQVLSGQIRPGKKILAVGYERVVLYRRIEVEEEEGE